MNIHSALCSLEKSGTSLWGLTAYEAFGRSLDKETWIVKKGDSIEGLIMMAEPKKARYVISLITKKGFNPKSFLMCFERIKRHYLIEKVYPKKVCPKISVNIQNEKLQKIALALGFVKKGNLYEFSIRKNKEKNAESYRINSRSSTASSGCYKV